ncbi:hypothetical protein CY34DRAFT_808967 [Suillus luteus UH-Slu-Lm8-n1]|uniref:Uncharacterized protein n=1 Tax=Suillus luteus UH-Slu-Lm8-n1 TaxID=930992 RepID=A0A0D0B4I3_9AGAM|nr:hypothetical protein CY34DRAFT_808967 [Suillus luteus UH-Slu-Lm8-n1]
MSSTIIFDAYVPSTVVFCPPSSTVSHNLRLMGKSPTKTRFFPAYFWHESMQFVMLGVELGLQNGDMVHCMN